METEFNNLETLLNNAICDTAPDIQLMEYDNQVQNNDYTGINLYQLQGIIDKSSCNIVHVGFSENKSIILINEFKLKNYECNIVSYLLSDADLELAVQTCKLKMIGIIFKKRNKIRGILSLNFYTFEHKKHKTEIKSLISFVNNNSITGYFTFEFQSPDGSIKKIGKNLNKYPGKTHSITMMLELLSDNYIKTVLCIN